MSSMRPGQFLKERVRERMIIAAMGIVVMLALAALGFTWWWVSLPALPIAYVLNRESEGGLLDPLQDRLGYLGERRAGDILDSLAKAGAAAEHDLLLVPGRGNIDHVALCPSGIYAIETKHWSGRFYTRAGHLVFSSNGRNLVKDKLLMRARGSAAAVHEVLAAAGIDRWVKPLIVSTKAAVWRGEFTIGDVLVVQAAGLESVLTRGIPILRADELSHARAVLDQARLRERRFMWRVLRRLAALGGRLIKLH